ncbi:hypothetical protein SAMN05216524_107250 [Mucilaginibacter sp. OK098]|nr:hypothetical protein SAMN05216524_107250 [Mucilaginibacter sp. OK098]
MINDSTYFGSLLWAAIFNFSKFNKVLLNLNMYCNIDGHMPLHQINFC